MAVIIFFFHSLMFFIFRNNLKIKITMSKEIKFNIEARNLLKEGVTVWLMPLR